jgi:hypothetical protein
VFLFCLLNVARFSAMATTFEPKYTPGVKVWFYHPQDAWTFGEISGVGSKKLMVLSEANGEEYSVK